MLDGPLGFYGFIPDEPPPSDPWGSRIFVYACGIVTGLIVAALVVAR